MKKFLITTAALIGGVAPAYATTFVETEPNDSVETAQLLFHDGSISLTGFREATSVNTFTDFFRFSATAGNNIVFRVNAIGNGDPVIRLLSGLGVTLADDDDSGEGLNALINYNITSTGDYIAAVRGFSNSQYNYEMTITGLTASAAIPEPATWAMMILGFGFIGGAMRYRTRSTKVRFATA